MNAHTKVAASRSAIAAADVAGNSFSDKLAHYDAMLARLEAGDVDDPAYTEPYTEAFEQLVNAEPETATDFLKKFRAMWANGGNPCEEAIAAMLEDADRLLAEPMNLAGLIALLREKEAAASAFRESSPDDKAQQEVLDEQAWALFRRIFTYNVSSMEELSQKVAVLSTRSEAYEFADTLVQDINRLSSDADDHVLLQAWAEARETKVHELEDEPPAGDWDDRLARAETALRNGTATSVAGVIAQLWTGVDHMIGSEAPAWLEAAIKTSDFDAIFERREELDFDMRMVVQALYGLYAMEARMAETAAREPVHA